MHIVSNVEGKLDDKHDALDALAAGFPAGTVSGAPKVRAMQIIDELEKEKRGLYAGCVGYFSAAGEMDTCIVLRTALVKDGTMYVQAGAGIVADSDPASEQGMRQQGQGAVPRRRRGAPLRLRGRARTIGRRRLLDPLPAPSKTRNVLEKRAMILLIDNYDSFTFNLVHYLGELGADVAVHRNDKIAVEDVLAAKPEAIVLSPGPCTPNEAGICLDLIEQASPHDPDPRRLPRPSGDRPGVRRQGRARAAAGARQALRDPPPGRRACSAASTVRSRRRATIRWWSSATPCRTTLSVTAETDDGLIMGLAHKTLPVHGVQFHPESIASEHGHLMLKNFLDLAAQWNAAHGRPNVH